MKTKMWMLMASMAFVVASSSAYAATTTESTVSAVTDAVGDAKFAQTQIGDATKGTFAGVYAASIGDVNTFITNALTSGNKGDVTIATGTAAVQTAAVGMATTNAIGGSGGVVSNRQLALRDERKSASEFGANAALASIRMNQNLANRIWASPFYTHQKQKDKDGYSGYTYKAWGVSLGYDRYVGDFAFGAAFTFSKGDYEQSGLRDDNDIKNYGVSLYGQYYNVCNGFFATLAGGYNYGDNDWRMFSEGNDAWVNSDNHTDSWWVGGNVGWDYQVNEALTLTPTLGLFWSEAKNSAYGTTGAIRQNFGRVKQKSFLMPLDLTATYRHQIDECTSVAFKLGAGYAYNFKRDRAEGSMTYVDVPGTVFIQGVRPERHSWNVTTGITYQVRNIDFGVDYRYDGMKKFNAHRVSATVGLSF